MLVELGQGRRRRRAKPEFAIRIVFDQRDPVPCGKFQQLYAPGQRQHRARRVGKVGNDIQDARPGGEENGFQPVHVPEPRCRGVCAGRVLERAGGGIGHRRRVAADKQ